MKQTDTQTADFMTAANAYVSLVEQRARSPGAKQTKTILSR